MLLRGAVALVCASALLPFGLARAEGYLGALITLGHVADGCVQTERCDKSGTGLRVYAGSRLAADKRVSFGRVTYTAVEVGLMKTAKARSSGETIKRVIDEDLGEPVDVPATASERTRATAITGAAVFELPLARSLVTTARIGLGYVSATLERRVDDLSIRSETKNTVSPYLGLGVEYTLTQRVRLVGAVDALRYRVGGQSGVISQFGLGAEAQF